MAHSVYRFGDCRIDLSARELHRDGELVTLSPKVFDCLAYLIEHRERAVGRDELIAAVWGKVDVSDTLLGQTVLKARRAIGDTGNEQHAIRTVPRFGYRWIAEVSQAKVPSSLPAADTHEAAASPLPEAAIATTEPVAAPASPRRHRNGWILALGLVALAALIAAAWQTRERRAPESAASPAAVIGAPASVAVLPAEVTSAAASQAWLRLGLMDLIATHLRGAGLGVMPSDNVVAVLRGHDAREDAVSRITAAAGVRKVVVPLVARAAAGWSVRLDLHEGDQLQGSFEARATDAVLAARMAADQLLAHLGRRNPHANAGNLPLDELLARIDAAQLTNDLAGARDLIEQAPASLRDLPDLRLRLAQIDFRAGRLDVAQQQLAALLPQAGNETEPLLRARILNALGAIAIRTRRNAEAEREFGEAIALLAHGKQPAVLGQAYTGLAISHAAQGDFDAAQANFSRARIALELAGDGLAQARVEENEGVVAARRGHAAEALAAHQRAAQRFERFGALNELILTRGNAASVQLALLDPAAALATIERSLPLLDQIENRRTRHALLIEHASVLARSGQLSEARKLLAELASDASSDSDPALLLARIHFEQARLDLAAGRPDEAAALAQSAVEAYADADHLRERAHAWLLLAQALRAAGKLTEASAQAAQLRAAANADQAPPLLLFAALAQAEATPVDAATTAYEDALARAAREDVPADTAQVLISWAARLIAAGELDRASALVGQVSRWAGQDFACALLQLRYYHALGEIPAWQTALQRAQSLAGERKIEPVLLEAPPARGTDSARGKGLPADTAHDRLPPSAGHVDGPQSRARPSITLPISFANH
ncbi:winged helix-turn-helix domain-containing protein [Dokdonella sp.]|uniref:winged helix-turn-helix domain-containing protein n=1 Tax=Dokdonella sp. TaxID=2291710 RepID=UPI0025C49AD6|nr:winged helix-turn-helix domain-containing protein [Dokdonella sp.]MBX3688110.1 winged helix-turn-helix domain-containing protein [Dokdonella sp.]